MEATSRGRESCLTQIIPRPGWSGNKHISRFIVYKRDFYNKIGHGVPNHDAPACYLSLIFMPFFMERFESLVERLFISHSDFSFIPNCCEMA